MVFDGIFDGIGNRDPLRYHQNTIMALTDIQVKNAKPKSTPIKLSDGDWMYLLVQPNGAKYWRFNYRFAGKQKTLALGTYPDVSLGAARKKRTAARELLASDPPIDPMKQRKDDRREEERLAEHTFENIAREWWENKRGGWSSSHTTAVLSRLERELFPDLGARPLIEIAAPELLDVIRRVERRGALELASKTLIIAGQVFRYAIATGRATADVSRDLRGALKTREVNHYAKLSEGELPEFLRKLDTYDGNALTRHALKMLMLTFVRTGELRGALWTEFDLEKREWRIPGERMKMGVEHIVPLSDQAVAILEKIKTLSGNRDYVFPNEHRPQHFMSENTVLYALYRMGYRGRATGHGFRATASTILNEQGWNADAIERQLAHGEKDKIRAAYNTAQYLPQRRKMMQHWANYLDKLKVGAKVIPLRGNAA